MAIAMAKTVEPFHHLCHCAATNLCRAGVDTVTARKTAGHGYPYIRWLRLRLSMDSWRLEATLQQFAGAYATGSRLDKTVGRNSATVGWICIARCTTVYGTFAYMTSNNT